ncbi:hypothetical protein [Algibacter marinivivus]|nr:hypothetical protein [Algibacter marinivivus]
MLKKLTIVILFLLTLKGYSQEGFDVSAPSNSTFQSSGSIEGMIQSSVNEVTGKVVFSAPMASISAGSISYGINLAYNGHVAFKNGQQTNKYSPTSVAGVGWNASIPKIIVDNKNTGTRDDDDFYLQDQGTNTKLICIDRGSNTTGSVWKFQAQKYVPWIIEFFYSGIDGTADYWKITKEDGLVYTFGNTSYSCNETVVRYGNWIGSSKQYSSAAARQTIVWNLYKIENQWNDYLTFTYNKVFQTMSGKEQTEAAYLSSITSSKGTSIQLTYGTKANDEFYEPNKEASEPDAYQERYEKKFLQSVSSYNKENELIIKNELGFTINGSGLNKKRYLTTLTNTTYNDGGQTLTSPSQTFDYHYSGTFKGGIKKITYPTGGAVTYNYENKFLFNNTANKFASSVSWPSGYGLHSRVVKDNYTLYLLRTTNPVTGNKYRFKIFRFWWNGESWEHNEFTFPHLIEESWGNGTSWDTLIDFHIVLNKDFYGFAYDKGSDSDVYLFHMNSDGRTWHDYTALNRVMGSGDPRFVSGDNFAALGAKYDGKIYTYLWNGTSWQYKHIDQGQGEYYLTAQNNFILSLDEKQNGSGVDMVTGVNHSDHYYIHYLDAEKTWQTKSWSAAADPYINNISISNTYPGNASFYADNSIAGLVAKDNNELFLRWNIDYNLTNVDNELGSYNDLNPIQPVTNSMFTLYGHITKRPYKSARFNGVSWSKITPLDPDDYSHLEFGVDMFSLVDYGNSTSRDYYIYNPNTNNWSSGSLNVNRLLHGTANYPAPFSPINSEFMIVGRKFFKRDTQGESSADFIEIGTLQNDTGYAYSDRLSHTFVEETGTPTDFTERGKFYYVDKNDGVLKYVTLLNSWFYTKNVSQKFGGYTPFMSTTSISLVDYNTTNQQLQSLTSTNRLLYRVIDDKVNNGVYDIVVSRIDIDDDNGSIREVSYNYNNPKSLPDNSSTFYGEVIVQNQGLGSGNIGKVIKEFDNGSVNLCLLGLPLEVITKDSNNNIIKKNTIVWEKNNKSFFNGSYSFYNSYYVRSISEKEEVFFNTDDIVSETTHTYNSYGQKVSSTTSNSLGESVKQETRYAHQEYTFVLDKNMLSFPYEIASKINNQTVSVNQSKWISFFGKVYIKETWSGPTTANMRLNSEFSLVEYSTGNVLENNNGKGLYNTILYGYDNLYQVAEISNAEYQDVINQLDVTYAQLQMLNDEALKDHLSRLYDRLPNAMISLTFYDDTGRVINQIDDRKEESYIHYDTQGRVDYITDGYGNVLEKKSYNFAN